MRQIWRRIEMIHLTIGWRRDERGTHNHTHGSWILWSVSNVRSKTMHSLFCIYYVMAALHYSMLHRFKIFSAPGTIAHGSIRLPPRSLGSSRGCSWAIILFYFIFNVNYNKKDLIRSGIFPHITRTFYIQFSFSFKSRKASLRNLSLNQFTLAF